LARKKIGGKNFARKILAGKRELNIKEDEGGKKFGESLSHSLTFKAS
jgi:hypothetical protein